MADGAVRSADHSGVRHLVPELARSDAAAAGGYHPTCAHARFFPGPAGCSALSAPVCAAANASHSVAFGTATAAAKGATLA